ncbi:uncharacterized protein C7orf57 [Nematostella vectensis]|uniref:uncharacterized protein C7orf57 n=1 Tax=Nematostella vectensis TaxID=45351 RepID=UPI0020773D50|nr:uncharacterized protein C7orf57 [Nematostella vectensis]
MPNPKTSSQDWYYHAPSKPVQKPAVEAPPASQIPGLSNVENIPEDVDERFFKRKWIRDTDSKYIKLAKGGGRKNLLSFKTPPQPSEEAVLYPRAEWFDHYHPEEEEDGVVPPVEQVFQTSKRRPPQAQHHHVLPEWYVHEEANAESHTQHQQQIPTEQKKKKKRANLVSFDNMTAWERQAAEDIEQHRRLPAVHKKKEQHKTVAKEAAPVTRKVVKLPKIDKEPVNFSHLMSFGYSRDWLSDQSRKERSEREKRHAEHKKQEEKKSMHIKEAANLRKPRTIAREDDKPMFKISRFERVQPRVESFRT